MKAWKCTAAGLGAAALALLSGTVAHAQNTFYGAGSSAVLNAALQGAVNQFPGGTAYIAGSISAPTGNVTSVSSSGTVTLVDAGSGVNTNTTTWFLYVQGTAPNQNIVFDGSYDSTIGNRALFNRDTYTSSGVAPAAAATAVSAAVNGQQVNIGFTDIRPEDALNATTRTLGLGYSATNPVLDLFGGSFSPIPFTISGNTTTAIGAAPVVFAVSAGLAASDPLLPMATNVNRATLGNILSGNLFHVGDLVPGTPPTGTAAGTAALTTYVREPISGTYNTTEFCAVATVEGALSNQALTQELGVNSRANPQPANANFQGNPLNESGVIATGKDVTGFIGGAAGGGRVRAIGTGQEVRATNQTPNALGYGFYSVGNFNPASATSASNLKYLTVDGVDPIFANYSASNGVFPATGTGVTLPNIANGSYPVWSLIRAVTLGSAPTGPIGTYLTSSIPGANGANVDFIAATNLVVFRAHRGSGANNGVLNPAAEAGSDVGGAIFLKVNERDFSADFNRSFTNARQ